MARRSVIALSVAAFVGVGIMALPRPTHSAQEQVINITAKKFEYSPSEVTVKKNVPVVLEIHSLDRDHGFKLREFGVRADIKPGETTRVRFTPNKSGRFPFRCDVFCGSGHEDMQGTLVVVD